MLAEDYHLEDLRSVRPASIAFDRSLLATPPPKIEEFIRRRLHQDGKVVEKRKAVRHDAMIRVFALELDQALEAVGDPFIACTRDLSTHGLGIIHTRPVTSLFLGIELPTPGDNSTQVLLHVLRCRPRGPYYDVAGEFITRFARATSES